MKTIYTVLIAILISMSGYAQPERINYKAVIKDNLGNIVANQTIDIKFSIIKSLENSVIYEETHTNKTTDANGILIVNIGDGSSTGSIVNVDWGSDIHILKTEIDIEQDGSFVNLGQTQFNSVPYALYAPDRSTGLEFLAENGSVGWRLIGRDADNFGTIGLFALDLSTGSNDANDYGATGFYSIAMGSGVRSSGEFSISIGNNTSAESYLATAMGVNNIGGGTNNSWFPQDPLFEIGNSISSGSPSNALTILKNGTITAPSFDISEITDNKALITKEFADSNYLFTPFSGNYNDLTNQPTIILPTGLERVTDINIGWRLIGQNAFYHTNIGTNAVDLAVIDGSTTGIGASGSGAFAAGSNTKAYGNYSTALGNSTSASGINSTAMGQNTIAIANSSTAIGKYNVADVNGLFMVGSGTGTSNRKNALIIKENGDSQFDGEIQNTSTGSANMIPVAYGNFDGDDGSNPSDILSGTDNFTITRAADFTYTISVNGVALSATNSTASVMVSTNFFRTANVTYSGGNMLVHIFNNTFSKVPAPFQFVVYKE